MTVGMVGMTIKSPESFMRELISRTLRSEVNSLIENSSRSVSLLRPSSRFALHRLLMSSIFLDIVPWISPMNTIGMTHGYEPSVPRL